MNSKLLSYPDFSKTFFLATDASNVGVGAVLYQDTETNALKFSSPNRKYIGFFSKSTSTERRYSANKKELLAIVKALHHFRYYIFGNPFVLITDHASLKYMNEQKYLNPALSNWSDIIFSYNFKIIHCPGKFNFLPDLLSRVMRPAISASQSVCSASIVDMPDESTISESEESSVEPSQKLRMEVFEKSALFWPFWRGGIYKDWPMIKEFSGHL